MKTRQEMALDGREMAAQALYGRVAEARNMGLEDYDFALCDALVTLMHFAERYGIDFGEELARADRHYAVESTYNWDEVPDLDAKEVTT